MEPLRIEGAYSFTPRPHGDHRGAVFEWFRSDALEERTGRTLNPAQANCSVSSRGVLRGVHFTETPPGQAKYVTCLLGAVVDVVVDVRVGSPAFGEWDMVRLDDENRRCVYIAEGLGHAFMALTDHATVAYLLSRRHDPGRERGVHPLDAELGIEWPREVEPVLSAKDAAALTLREAESAGLLPSYRECLDHYAEPGRPR